MLISSDIKPILEITRAEGTWQTTRLGQAIEVENLVLRWNARHFPERAGLAWKLGVVEGLQIVSGYFDERHIAKAAPKLVHEYGVVHGYGLKIAQQLPNVIRQLRLSSNTRRALIHIGKPEDGYETEKPCMQTYQFLIRQGLLRMTVFARSWDLVYGMPYDVTAANIVAQVVASQLEGVSAHTTTFMATSAHVYDEAYQRAALPGTPYKRSTIDVKPGDDYRSWAIDLLNGPLTRTALEEGGIHVNRV